jgi:hypothetical protein
VFVVYLGVVLIPVVRFVVLLCPAGIGVLLPFLVWNFLPFFRYDAFLDLLVLVPGVALAGSFHKACIYDLALMGNKAMFFQKACKLVKKLFVQSLAHQTVLKSQIVFSSGTRSLSDKPRKRQKDNLSNIWYSICPSLRL